MQEQEEKKKKEEKEIVKDTMHRKFMITINDPFKKGYTHDVINQLLQTKFKNIVYYCFAEEKGSKHHIHIYTVFKNPVRFSKIKKVFQERTYRLCKTEQVNKIASIYEKNGKWATTRKQETTIPDTFEEWGEMPLEHQGIKAEVADVYMSIKDGLTDTEIMELYPNEAYNVDKFERIRQRIKADENASIRRDVTVWYIWGSTGLR